MGGGGKKNHQAFTIEAPAATEPASSSLATATEAAATIVIPDDVHNLATAAGFDHAETMSPQALAHWLHPDTDATIKTALQTKADERHHDATTVDLTPGVDATEPPDDNEVPFGSWKATPAEVLAAHTAFLEAYAQYKPTDASTVAPLIGAENHLALAYCPEISEQLAATVESARVTIDTHPPHPFAVWPTIDVGIENATVDTDVEELLNSDDALKLMRSSTPPETRAELVALIEKRRSERFQLDDTRDALLAELNGGHFDPVNLDYLPPTAAAAADYFAAHDAVTAWTTQPRMHPSAKPEPMPATPDGLATEFRQWAKHQPLPGLRATAVDMGLAPAAAQSAKRTQLQNWVISSWHPKMDSADIAASIVAPAAPTPPKTPPPASAGPDATTTTPSAPPATKPPSSGASPSPSVTAGSGRWHAKQPQLVAALKHHSAAHSDLPARPDPAMVKNWSFTTGPAMSLGGAHTKSVHTAPDGSTWMFKPDKLGGARAAAEAGANSVLHRVGIPTVGVYEHSIGNKAGTVQPLMSGASTLSSNPSSWSQADVDSIVRYHVAAWVIGDHDAKHDNLLRTPSGGLVPIDHGQAFKFYGQDKLATSYHPNSSYGAAPPVWHTAYKAAKAGKLAPGVKVRPEAAAGVIKAFETLPDTEFRSLLYKTAHQGASNPAIHWRSTMANTAGSGASSNEIATAFLNHATERKTSLRTKFAMFFATEGIAGADTLTKVN